MFDAMQSSMKTLHVIKGICSSMIISGEGCIPKAPLGSLEHYVSKYKVNVCRCQGNCLNEKTQGGSLWNEFANIWLGYIWKNSDGES